MKKTSEPIVFFGSGPVAAQSLELLARHCSIAAVITKPRPDHHRGSVPVLDAATTLGLAVYTAENKATLDALFAARPVESRLAVLIDFGIIVSQSVIDYFPLGIVNSHFSLLPEWRGADPITFALLSGQAQTGVSLMLLVEKMDEGPLLAQATYDIQPDDTNTTLSAALIELSDQLLTQTLPAYLSGNLTPYEQTEDSPAGIRLQTSYSRKLTKQDSILDFTKSAVQLEREVRAFADWPKSKTTLGGVEVTVTQSHVGPKNGPIGTFQHDRHSLGIFTAEGTFFIDQLKPAGKANMTIQAFLAGYGHKL